MTQCGKLSHQFLHATYALLYSRYNEQNEENAVVWVQAVYRASSFPSIQRPGLSLEFKFLSEHVHIHPRYYHVRQIPTAHLAKHPSQSVVQVGALVLTDVDHPFK